MHWAIKRNDTEEFDPNRETSPDVSLMFYIGEPFSDDEYPLVKIVYANYSFDNYLDDMEIKSSRNFLTTTGLSGTLYEYSDPHSDVKSTMQVLMLDKVNGYEYCFVNIRSCIHKEKNDIIKG